MITIKIFLAMLLFYSGATKELHAQKTINSNRLLDVKQQSIISISAFTATGDLIQLEKALSEAFKAGMTINEVKEVLIHQAAYCGFPRSLQGINTFIAVVEARKAQGIQDKVGREATSVQYNWTKYEQGKKVLETLTGQPAQKAGYAVFAPVIDSLLKEYLFGDIFGRDILSYTEREMATISALISLGGVEPMLQSHMKIALNIGITEPQLRSMFSLLEEKMGKEKAEAGRRVLNAISNNKEQNSIDSNGISLNIYEKGSKAPAINFTCVAWVNMVVQAQHGMDGSVGVVTFEPQARTNWHKHPGGQILLITEGKGYYQEKGHPIRIIQKGDVVKCIPGTEHWHGASPEDTLIHIAIIPNTDKGNTIWLQKVTDKEYQSFK